MKSFREIVGMDLIDLIIHAGVTSTVIGFVAMSGGPEELFPVLTGLSLLVFAARRRSALQRMERLGLNSGEMAAERLAELELRMAELESAQARVAELEERLDFAERLLARAPERVLPDGGER